MSISVWLSRENLYNKGQGDRWPYDASWRLGISGLGVKEKLYYFLKQRKPGDPDVQFWHYAKKSRLRRSHCADDHTPFNQVCMATYAYPREDRTRRKRLRIKRRTDRQEGQTDHIMGIKWSISLDWTVSCAHSFHESFALQLYTVFFLRICFYEVIAIICTFYYCLWSKRIRKKRPLCIEYNHWKIVKTDIIIQKVFFFISCHEKDKIIF